MSPQTLSNETSKNCIVITDDDINWVEQKFGNAIQFDQPRREIIKNLSQADIQAFPGSGKTTLLVAKLAVLAKKWSSPYLGICVLSHTNTARKEIQQRLGNSGEGAVLLSSPHFVGTLHSFFNNFVSIPYLRSRGIQIKLIDNEFVKNYRWRKLPHNTQYHLKLKKSGNLEKAKLFCVYTKKWGAIEYKSETQTQKNLLKVIKDSQKEGYFTHDELLLLAQYVLAENPAIARSIQTRFPYVFVDEAQDTNLLQLELLRQTFLTESSRTVLQNYGDQNQSIYNNIEDNFSGSFFRNEAEYLSLPQSKRFDSRIATLANTVVLNGELMSGTDNKLSGKNARHMIFLFSPNNIDRVKDEFGLLIHDTFSDDELCCYKHLGCHVIGLVHTRKGNTKLEHFPKGLYEYWSDYKINVIKINALPNRYISFVRLGDFAFEETNNLSEKIDWIAKGICYFINFVTDRKLTLTGHTFNNLLETLSDQDRLRCRGHFLKMASVFPVTKQNWSTILEETNAILNLLGCSKANDINSFFQWQNDEFNGNKSDIEEHKLNSYRFEHPRTKRCIELEFGSIHSTKGQTHLATLVVETHYHKHVIRTILPYLCGEKPAEPKKRISTFLKSQYVAMTRACGLLCLALPKCFVNSQQIKQLKAIGWEIKLIE